MLKVALLSSEEHKIRKKREIITTVQTTVLNRQINKGLIFKMNIRNHV